MSKLYVLKIESASTSLTARYSTLLALKQLVDAGLIKQSYLTKYRNKNTKRSTAIAYIRKHADFAIIPVAKSGNVTRYEVYLRIKEQSCFAKPTMEEALIREEDGDAYHEALVNEQLERIALNI